MVLDAEKIKIVCIKETCGRYTTQRLFKEGEIIFISKYSWGNDRHGLYEFDFAIDNVNVGWYDRK